VALTLDSVVAMGSGWQKGRDQPDDELPRDVVSRSRFVVQARLGPILAGGALGCLRRKETRAIT